jgi:hypothetical protein
LGAKSFTVRGLMANSPRESLTNLALAGVALLAVTLLACSTAELSKKGADVITSQSAPVDSGYDPKTCKHLGFVIGNGGGAFGGAWISNENLVQYAMNDLRNKAAQLGANFVQHDTPQMGVSGDNKGTNTTTATVSGNAYFCSGEKGAAVTTKPAPKPASPPVAEKPLPEGVAGFRFGNTVEQTKKLCEDAGHQFTLADTLGTCSNSVVDLHAPGEVKITFCDNQACRIEVDLRPQSENYARFILDLSKQLSSRYGEKSTNKSQLSKCPKYAEELAQCVLNDTANVLYEWSWPSKHVVSLSTEHTSLQSFVALSYGAPDYTKTHAPGPAL